ncbi:hypothetical protein ACFRCI_09380 [Streptomyces sp. NPDC056638]|uniref:hypothetical protein n=1 Tax=Streptomyces sp. NPDC056638 TaxID=3345887 RepID=UPI0036A9860A
MLDRVGDNANRLHRRLSAATTNSSAAVNRFTTDANGRLRDLRGRFLAAGDGARRLQDDTSGLPGALRNVSTAAGEAGASGGSLTPVLAGVAAVVGLSLLPALGALVPMMAGAGMAAGTLKLGFAGIGDAIEASGEDQKKYAEALKKLSPEARTFTKELVGLKKEFGGLGKDIQKAMLPGFTAAVKSAGPVVKVLGQGMTSLGKGFGDAAAGAGRLFGQGGFQRDLKANLDLGMVFVREMSGGVGALLKSLLDFGAKSGPTLRAFSTGLSGLLGKGGGGLAGMFKGLETGIGGSAALLNGLFSMINRLLPAIGRFSGEVARTFGPLLGELAESSGLRLTTALDGIRLAIRGLSPVFKDLMFGVKATNDLMKILAPTMRDVGSALLGAFLPAFTKVDEARGPLRRLSDAINENKGAIQEAGRIMGSAFIDMASAAIQYLPPILGLFRTVTGGMLTALGGVLHAAASAFGWIPGIGDKLKKADRAFSSFKDTFLSGLDAAERKTRDFAAGALPKLEQGKLKLNINNWNSQIETAKAKLKTVPPEKKAAIRAQIADLQEKVRQAKAALATVQSKTVSVMVNYRSSQNPSSFAKSIGGYATGGRPTPGEWAWVGEQGPELVQFKGGETVYDHGTSMGMTSPLAAAGQDAGRGLSAGMVGSAAGVEASARRMAAAVTAGVRAELEIASPSKKMKALMADVGKGIIIGLTGTKAKISATAKDLVKDIWKAWEGAKSTKDSKLVRMVNADTKKLLKLADQRDALAARIKAAKDYAKSVTTGARQAANLDQLGMDPEEVTAGGIKAGLAQKLAKLKTFTSYINMLAKKGLNKSLLRQILDMGPEAGYAYASALAGADKTTFNSINSLETQLNHGADKLGTAGADAMYDSGKQAGKGFLTGLQSQQKAIEDQMVEIAKGMQKAIKKALGIKSPSRVMAQLGRYSTEGLAAGLTERMPVLDRALGAVTDRVASAQPVIGRPAVIGGGAGARPVQIQIDVHGAMDPVAVGRELQRVLLQLKRTQGLNVQLGVA